MLPCGILNLHKPAEMTSRRSVDLVQRLVRPARAGHAGTLDPLATGVLVVCVGAATRLIGYVQRMPKRYTGTFLLGRQSPTEDVEGDVTELPDAPIPTHEQIAAAAAHFVGRIQQRPPAYSALKIAGRPAYKLARQGKQPQLAARPVEIHRIDIVAYQYPELVLDVQCGSGTYIRSLGRDLAESLGTAAVMSALVRLSVGSFSLDDAVDPRSLNADNLPLFLQPPLRAVEYLPRVQLSAEEVLNLHHGLTIQSRWEHEGQTAQAQEIVAMDPVGGLVGILTPGAAGRLRTLRNMPTNESGGGQEFEGPS
jgi:tRNA pseudouridine55 synthase